jgi:pimeloyl-ACP methyl ester carboxylesterase
MMAYVKVVETNPKQLNLPARRVIHEDPDLLAALTPEDQSITEIAVAQSMDLLASYRNIIRPALAMADHEFLKRLGKNFRFSFDIRSLPEPFQAPALFLTGRFDHWVGYQAAYQLLDQYPRATFAVLDRAGHAIAIEQKSLFRALVGEWLDRVEEYIGEK